MHVIAYRLSSTHLWKHGVFYYAFVIDQFLQKGRETLSDLGKRVYSAYVKGGKLFQIWARGCIAADYRFQCESRDWEGFGLVKGSDYNSLAIMLTCSIIMYFVVPPFVRSFNS